MDMTNGHANGNGHSNGDLLQRLGNQDIDALLLQLTEERRRRAEEHQRQLLGPPPKPQENYFDFIRKHGAGWPAVKVLTPRDHRDTGIRLLPDGARVEHNGIEHTLVPPPDEPLQQMLASQQYHQLFLQMVEEDFGRLKEALEGRGYGYVWPADGKYGPAHADGLRALVHLQRLVFNEREILADLETKISADPRIQHQRAIDAERERQEQEYLAQKQRRESELQHQIAETVI